jgi:hypothetical protein
MLTSIIKHKFLISVLCIASVAPVTAQTSTSTQTHYLDGNNCESVKAYFDLIDIEAGDANGTDTIIIIARLGDGERSRRLNRRRLYLIRRYLNYIREIPEERLVTAEGERVAGRARLEIYLKGKLFMVLAISRNRQVGGIDCQDTYNTYTGR